MKRNDNFNFKVLYTQTIDQQRLYAALEKAFPKDRGSVLLPMMEHYRRDRKEMEIRPLFPGYLFIHSDFGLRELHEFIRDNRTDLGVFVRELGLSERRKGEDRDVFSESDDRPICDISEEEREFLETMLDDDGVLRMSVGYREGEKVVITEGPLKYYEERIVNVDRHNRRAFLNFEFLGRVIRAGLEIRPKRWIFPYDKDAPEVLSDGTEVDISKLEKRMMGG